MRARARVCVCVRACVCVCALHHNEPRVAQVLEPDHDEQARDPHGPRHNHHLRYYYNNNNNNNTGQICDDISELCDARDEQAREPRPTAPQSSSAGIIIVSFS